MTRAEEMPGKNSTVHVARSAPASPALGASGDGLLQSLSLLDASARRPRTVVSSAGRDGCSLSVSATRTPIEEHSHAGGVSAPGRHGDPRHAEVRRGVERDVRARGLLLAALASALALGAAARTRADVVERVVAVVNDDAIFLSDLRTKAAPFLERAMAMPNERQRQEAIRTVYEQVLEVLINQRLILQAAEEDDITVSTSDVDDAVATMRTESGLDEADFWDAVAAQGHASREAFRRDIREQLLQYQVLNARVRSRVNITEEDVRERYDEMVAQARRSARFTAADIVVPFGADPSATTLAAARRRAEEIRAGIDDVDSFEDAMREHHGFELGTLDEGDLDGDLEAALAELEEGEVSPPVRGSRGFHLLLLRERELGSDEIDPYEDVWQDLYREMLSDAMERQQELFIEELRRAATIDRRLD